MIHLQVAFFRVTYESFSHRKSCQVSLLKQDFERRERSLQQMLEQVGDWDDPCLEVFENVWIIGKNGTIAPQLFHRRQLIPKKSVIS